MKHGEHSQDADVDLVRLLTLLWVLELGGQKHLRELTVTVTKGLPSFGGQFLVQGS